MSVYKSQRWKDFREEVLRKFPTCQMPGCSQRSNHVDHITAMRKGGSAFSWENVQALCPSCHSRKTVMRDGGFGRPASKKFVAIGCDENGMPLDPNHPWRK